MATTKVDLAQVRQCAQKMQELTDSSRTKMTRMQNDLSELSHMWKGQAGQFINKAITEDIDASKKMSDKITALNEAVQEAMKVYEKTDSI